MPKQILESPNGPSVLGPYSIATEANGFVFLSGMVALNPKTGEAVTGGVIPETHQVLKNIRAVLGDVGLGFDDVVKTTIFLADMDDFSNVNAVYSEYIGDAKPARSTIEVAALPRGFRVEIECIAAR